MSNFFKNSKLKKKGKMHKKAIRNIMDINI